LDEAGPIVENVKAKASAIDNQLKELIRYYGEDPALMKPEAFFANISLFSLSFEVCQSEILPWPEVLNCFLS
jgi:hypothetical protein